MSWIARHPITTALIALAGVFVSILSLLEPKYTWVTDKYVCGYNINVSEKKPPHEFEECSHPSHGTSGWGFKQTISGTSGWRGGGYNPTAWCNDVMRGFEAKQSEKIHWGKPQPREESRRSGLGNVRYNYHCVIEAKSTPTYHIKRSKACGKMAMIRHEVQESKSCFDESKRIGWKFKWQ